MSIAEPPVPSAPVAEPAADEGPASAPRLHSPALTGLFVLAVLYTVALARPLLFPVAVAVLLYFLLRPAVRLFERLHVRRLLGSAVVVLVLVAMAVVAIYALARPASDWMARAPQMLRRVEAKAHAVIQRVERVNKTAQQVEKITTPGSDDTPEVQVKEPGLGAQLFGGVQATLWAAVMSTALLFLLLASGESLLRNLIRLLPGVRGAEAGQIARAVEKQLSSYLFTLTAIYLGYGALVGLVMGLLGMPNPALWGALAAGLNFVPYLGPLVCAGVLGLAAMLTFSGLGHALLVPAVYLTMHVVETNVVTPMILSRQLTLNPPVVFLGLLFWLWVWGVPGGLLAVPMMAAVKIVCDHVPRLHALAELLGGEPKGHGSA